MQFVLYICHQLTELFGEIAPRLPVELVEPVEKMINRDVRYRPTAQLFMLVSPFASVFVSVPVLFCPSVASLSLLSFDINWGNNVHGCLRDL